jgi:hypothetical protein
MKTDVTVNLSSYKLTEELSVTDDGRRVFKMRNLADEEMTVTVRDNNLEMKVGQIYRLFLERQER